MSSSDDILVKAKVLLADLQHSGSFEFNLDAYRSRYSSEAVDYLIQNGFVQRVGEDTVSGSGESFHLGWIYGLTGKSFED